MARDTFVAGHTCLCAFRYADAVPDDDASLADGQRDPAPTAVEHRHASWLELFFDLVFVAFIGQLALRLRGAPGPSDFAVFALLLFPAWWTWINILISTNLFGRRATGAMWLVMGPIMFAVGVMAASVSDDFASRAWAFAAANALIRFVMLPVWLKSARKSGTAAWRPMTYNGITGVLWLISIAIPQPAQYGVWAVAIIVEIALAAVVGRQSDWLRRALDIEHIAERVGLFVVIVFGESILTLIIAASAHWDPTSGATALLGFVLVTLLAWSFFSYGAPIAERSWAELRDSGDLGALRDTTMFLPFFLVTGVVLMAAGLGSAVSDPDRSLPMGAAIALCGGVALFYATNGAVTLRYRQRPADVLFWAVPGVVGPLILATLSPLLTSLALVAILTAYLIAQVASARWLRLHRERIGTPSR